MITFFIVCVYLLLVAVSVYVALTYDNMFAATIFVILVAVIPITGGWYQDYKLKEKMEAQCEEIGVAIVRGIETPVYNCEK